MLREGPAVVSRSLCPCKRPCATLGAGTAGHLAAPQLPWSLARPRPGEVGWKKGPRARAGGPREATGSWDGWSPVPIPGAGHMPVGLCRPPCRLGCCVCQGPCVGAHRAARPLCAPIPVGEDWGSAGRGTFTHALPVPWAVCLQWLRCQNHCRKPQGGQGVLCTLPTASPRTGN